MTVYILKGLSLSPSFNRGASLRNAKPTKSERRTFLSLFTSPPSRVKATLQGEESEGQDESQAVEPVDQDDQSTASSEVTLTPEQVVQLPEMLWEETDKDYQGLSTEHKVMQLTAMYDSLDSVVANNVMSEELLQFISDRQEEISKVLIEVQGQLEREVDAARAKPQLSPAQLLINARKAKVKAKAAAVEVKEATKQGPKGLAGSALPVPSPTSKLSAKGKTEVTKPSQPTKEAKVASKGKSGNVQPNLLAVTEIVNFFQSEVEHAGETGDITKLEGLIQTIKKFTGDSSILQAKLGSIRAQAGNRLNDLRLSHSAKAKQDE